MYQKSPKSNVLQLMEVSFNISNLEVKLKKSCFSRDMHESQLSSNINVQRLSLEIVHNYFKLVKYQ